MHNHDHAIALVGIALLFAVPILTGIHNDRKRARHPHPSELCAGWFPGGPYANPYPCPARHAKGSAYCADHQ